VAGSLAHTNVTTQIVVTEYEPRRPGPPQRPFRHWCNCLQPQRRSGPFQTVSATRHDVLTTRVYYVQPSDACIPFPAEFPRAAKDFLSTVNSQGLMVARSWQRRLRSISLYLLPAAYYYHHSYYYYYYQQINLGRWLCSLIPVRQQAWPG
jgi:hypothetical protein